MPLRNNYVAYLEYFILYASWQGKWEREGEKRESKLRKVCFGSEPKYVIVKAHRHIAMPRFQYSIFIEKSWNENIKI